MNTRFCAGDKLNLQVSVKICEGNVRIFDKEFVVGRILNQSVDETVYPFMSSETRLVEFHQLNGTIRPTFTLPIFVYWNGKHEQEEFVYFKFESFEFIVRASDCHAADPSTPDRALDSIMRDISHD